MLTPLEKALELVNKYHKEYDLLWDLTWIQAKLCASIAVDELIRIAPWGSDIDGEIEDDSKEYYIEVKQEIEKL
jgi:hypothetical protein